MSRFAILFLSLTLSTGFAFEFVSEARAAAAFFDANVCIAKRCKHAMGKGIQMCTTNCLMDVDANKKKNLCK